LTTAQSNDTRIRIFPPLVFMGGLGIGLLLQWLMPYALLPFGAPRWLGALLLILGILLAAWGRNTMHQRNTSPNPALSAATLVTTGPFRFSRNPLYIASTLAYLGIVILTNALWTLVTLVPILLIVHYGIVRGEERYLQTQFGDAYREYCARVRRYI